MNNFWVILYACTIPAALFGAMAALLMIAGPPRTQSDWIALTGVLVALMILSPVWPLVAVAAGILVGALYLSDRARY